MAQTPVPWLPDRRVGGYAADASIAIGSGVVPDDAAANYHRVGGKAANPTVPPSGHFGVGIDSNIVTASFKSVLSAVNRHMAADGANTGELAA